MATRTLTTSGEEVLPRNRLRKSWVIQNEDAAITVYIKQERAATPTVSSTNHDHAISAGSSIALSSLVDGQEQIEDRWTAVAASGTPRISVLETETVVR